MRPSMLAASSSSRRCLSDGPFRPQQDVGEVIASLAASQWADRKDGLLALQAVLRSNRMLTASELKRITEIFTKMFMDTHTKVRSGGPSVWRSFNVQCVLVGLNMKVRGYVLLPRLVRLMWWVRRLEDLEG